MARPRQTASKASSAGELKCPECGKAFNRAASLGAHRNRAHGVTGATKRRRKVAQNKTTHVRRQSHVARVNRDQLLQALFPNGVPAREDVIRRVGSWLDEAEQLAKL